ncbi:MAG: CehA/McbA family metallohydrolase [Calditrichaeota bacterium]|nr:CehA/McbA family metallohydrolase [Calditrichota bacterium]
MPPERAILEWPGILILSLLTLFLAYAEVHYRLWKIRGRLYQDMPEILFDLPHRSQLGKDVPLFLFINDADQFPVELKAVTWKLRRASAPHHSQEQTITFSRKIEQPFFSQVIWIPASYFVAPGDYLLEPQAIITRCGREQRIDRDNYPGLSKHPLTIFLDEAPLPTLPNWYWGDMHVHSHYTRDAIEFAAPILETVTAARSLGLHFLAITDHSYDFQNHASPGERWQAFQQEVARVNHQSANFCVLAGEEVSVGNHRNQNVHCLVIGHPEFLPGAGDGALKPLNNRPELRLEELIARIQSSQALIAAAHPFDRPPRSHQWILNRGYWHPQDLTQSAINCWQILNGLRSPAFYQGLTFWKQQLLQGRRITLLAGNDAHGNFNLSRHVHIPLIRLRQHRHQILGRMRTGVWLRGQYHSANLLTALQRGQSVISSGPLLSLEVSHPQGTFHIGQTLPGGGQVTLRIQAQSSHHCGVITRIVLFFGDTGQQQEVPLEISVPRQQWQFASEISYPISSKMCYIRGELYTDNGQMEHFCYTNPIWIAED